MDFKTSLEQNNNIEITKWVITGIDLNKIIEYKYPIFYLIKNNNIEMIELFFKYGANVNSYSCECYQTPIMYAAELQNDKIIKLLISYGANISFVGNEGYKEDFSNSVSHFNLNSSLVYWYYNWNPFFSAYDYGNVNAVKYVLREGLFEMKEEYLNYFTSNLGVDERMFKKRNKIKNILNESMKKWAPKRHYLFHKNIRNNISILFHLRQKLTIKKIILPIELWWKICDIISY